MKRNSEMEIKRSGLTLRIAETGYRKAERLAQTNATVAIEPKTATFRRWR
jgi:hypothetical protein